MGKLKLLTFIGLSMVISATTASYAGPFLLWGTENLNNLKVPALKAIDDKLLRDIYSTATSIVVFIRNSTTMLSNENFPRLSEIVATTKSLYLAQDQLSSDPFEFNVNVEVFVLTGPVEQQDVEIAALYRDAQVNQKNVLGILATRHEHAIYKRQASAELSSTTEPPQTTTPSDEPVSDNQIFNAKGKGILYTTNAPVLRIRGNKSSEDVILTLGKHAITTADERADTFKLIVKFVEPEHIPVKFVFLTSGGWWTLNAIEVFYAGKETSLEKVGQAISAPFNFSYACNDSFVFGKESMTLTLKTIQVQPMLNGRNNFSRPYDCVGVTSPAILSGIFVTFILGIALTIGITAILDIKTPNKFENRSSKQLTFTVQE